MQVLKAGDSNRSSKRIPPHQILTIPLLFLLYLHENTAQQALIDRHELAGSWQPVQRVLETQNLWHSGSSSSPAASHVSWWRLTRRWVRGLEIVQANTRCGSLRVRLLFKIHHWTTATTHWLDSTGIRTASRSSTSHWKMKCPSSCPRTEWLKTWGEQENSANPSV